MAQAVLILAHGQPSDPAPAAAELQALADRVAPHLPKIEVAAATLAAPGAISEAVQALGAAEVLVYPLFMASGWFTAQAIPARLAEAGAKDWPVLPPFGEDPALQDLALQIVEASGAREVLLAAHGSFKSPVPAAIAAAVAQKIRALPGVERADAAFIDQSPRLAEMRGFAPDALCLPFFAMAGGHVVDDLPQALGEAGFEGKIAPPIGLDPRVPKLIAAAVLRGFEGLAERV